MTTNQLARIAALVVLLVFSVVMLIAASNLELEQRLEFSTVVCLTSPYVISLILTVK